MSVLMIFKCMRSRGLWPLLFIGLGVFGGANSGQTQTLGAVEQRLDRLEKIAQQLERAAEKTSQSSRSRIDLNVRMDQRLSELERAIANLVSTQERGQRDMAGMVDQLQRMKGDVERRLDSLENQSQPAGPPPSAKAIVESKAIEESVPVPLDADARFAQAMAYAVRQDWPQAELAFDTFVASYPSHAKLPEAGYQLGRAFQAQGKNAHAAKIFLNLYEQYPDSPFAVESLFALGSALSDMGPENAGQTCDVYGEIEAGHGSLLSIAQRSQLLDRRLALQCSR